MLQKSSTLSKYSTADFLSLATLCTSPVARHLSPFIDYLSPLLLAHAPFQLRLILDNQTSANSLPPPLSILAIEFSTPNHPAESRLVLLACA